MNSRPQNTLIENIEGLRTDLGLRIYLIVPAIAIKRKVAEVATYNQPRKGFFPPTQATVEITTDFVPE